MAGFCKGSKVSDVKDKINYISGQGKHSTREDVVDFYSSCDLKLWSVLAKESQAQHKPQVHKKIVKINGVETVKTVVSKCCEARQFIVALPQDCQWTAKEITEWFKEEYGVECAVALHWKEAEQNYHAHIVYSERELLAEPVRTEPKVAQRNYYYDSKGKKCKKADAVKVIPKGTVLKKGEVRYFADKRREFKTFSFAMDFKHLILHDSLGLPEFDSNRHFPTKHLGYTQREQDKEYNRLVNALNEYFDLIEPFYEGSTPKKAFCSTFGVSSIKSVENAVLSDLIAEFKEMYPYTVEMAENRISSLTEQENEYRSDLEHAETMYQPSTSVVQQDLNRIYQQKLEAKYQSRGDHLISKIKSLLDWVVAEIKWVVSASKRQGIDLSAERQHNITDDFDDYDY